MARIFWIIRSNLITYIGQNQIMFIQPGVSRETASLMTNQRVISRTDNGDGTVTVVWEDCGERREQTFPKGDETV